MKILVFVKFFKNLETRSENQRIVVKIWIFLETTKRIILRAFKSGRSSDAGRRRNGRSGSELSQVRTVIYRLDVRFATRDLFARAKWRVISKMGNKKQLRILTYFKLAMNC